MSTPTHGWDQSWSYLKPKDAKAHGLGVVAGYLSYTPSKNLTAADVKAYHKHGIAVILNWESEQGRPLGGAVNGHADGAAAKGQAEALFAGVGYRPNNRPAIYFSCDTPVTAAQLPACDAYYGATKAELGDEFRNGAYGQASLVQHEHQAGLTDCEWQTLAWSYGAVYQGADYYQTGINATLNGASIDFDDVRHAHQLGAWWPPGHPLDAPRRQRRPVPPPKVPNDPRHGKPKAHHYRWRVGRLLERIAKLRARLTHRRKK